MLGSSRAVYGVESGKSCGGSDRVSGLVEEPTDRHRHRHRFAGTFYIVPVCSPPASYIYCTGTRHHPRYIRASASARRRAGMPQTSPPVCVWNGATWSREGHLYTMFDYSGKRHFRVEQGTEVLSNATAVWHESAVLSWLSCEQNLNHFVGETLGPAHRAAAANTNRTSDPHLIITSPAMWPHPHPDGCVGHPL